MKELVVISGKGGTGKTSIVASFATLVDSVILADCDVDAADLHLVLEPTVVEKDDFVGGSCARILSEACTGCGKCEEVCRFGAVVQESSDDGKAEKVFRVDPIACEGCGVCAYFCPEDAVEFAPVVNGQWFISDTRRGPMLHAKLGVAAENSGKLVSLLRRHARRIAEEQKRDLVLVDGAPGIGCPVIASITGADLVLVVTEPTRSGLHDLRRVSDLTKHFGIETLVCVNKWDLNQELTLEIEAEARQRSLRVAGRVRYDQVVTKAQISKQSVVEYSKDGIAKDIKQLWFEVLNAMYHLVFFQARSPSCLVRQEDS
jgi:MinD superfamily P-loop ATPase